MTDMQKKLHFYFSSKDEVEIAFLYGSFAKGLARADSDVDIGVALKEKMTIEQKVSLLEELSLIVKRPIDLVDLHEVHAPFSQEVLARGIVLKNTNPASMVKANLYRFAN